MRRAVMLLSAVVFSYSVSTTWAAKPDMSGAEKLGWKLTLQTWTTKGTVAQSIENAKSLGIHFIEIYPGQQLSDTDKGKWGPEMTDEQIKAMLELAKSADATIIDTGVIGIASKEDDARKLFAWAKKVGITTIISEPEENALPMIDKLAGEFAINVALHDHPKPSRYWDPDYTYEQIRDLKHIGYCADLGHWKRSGLEPVDVLKKYGERVFSSHFKDLVPNDDKKTAWHDVPWGTGESKAAEMLAVLKQKGFKGPISLEYEAKWDLPTLQKCVDFFHEQANQLAK